MKTGVELSIGEKLKQIREAKDVKQEAVAKAVKYSAGNLSYLENGRHDCSSEVAREALKYLGVKGVPLYETERPGFRHELSKWYDLASSHKFDEANEMQKALSDIKYLPFDEEFNAFFDMFSCRLSLAQNKFDEGKAILDKYETILDKLNDEVKYHYFYNQGTFEIRNSRYKEALEFYKKAHELSKDDFDGFARLYLNISTCLTNLGYVVSSIMFLEEIHEISKGQIALTTLHMNHKLAIEYIKLGHLPKAKRLLDKCYKEAKDVNNEILLGSILNNYGLMYRMASDWNMSLKYLDQASDYFDKGSTFYLDNLYQKIQCFIEMGCFSECTELLAEGRELSKEDECYTILFESLGHLMTPNDSKSINYLETVTLPYLLKKSYVITALYYCEFLREYYEKKGIQKKTLQMTEIARTIYKEKLEGGVFL